MSQHPDFRCRCLMLALVLLFNSPCQAAEGLALKRQQLLRHVDQAVQQYQVTQAINLIDQWLADHVEDEDILKARVKLNNQLGHLKEAVGDYQRLIKLRPNIADYYGSLAWLYITQGQFKGFCRKV